MPLMLRIISLWVFTSPPPGEGGNANNHTFIPDWVTKQTLFKEFIETKWDKNFKEEDAFKKLLELTELIGKAAKEVIRKKQTNSPHDRTPSWKTALRTFQTLHTKGDVESVRLAAKEDPNITKLVEDFLHNGDKNTSSVMLKDYLDQHIEDNFINSPVHEEVKVSRVERLSKAFPSQRARITYLLDEKRESTEDPTEMANITKKYWQQHYIYKKLQKNLSRFWRRHYIGKLISIQPEEVTLDLVEKTIIESGATAPGPDNIPFCAYKVLVELAAPVFLGVIRLLMKGVLPPAGFNNAIFHLLPKKDTGLVSDTRPLSVSNTANRIIASVIKEAIQDSLYSFLNRDQCGFWAGRNMEENLDYFNELFYKAYDNQEEYSMFLFDIAKAFDSVGHNTIHSLLKHVGLPQGFCNAIKGLFHNITLTTNFKGGINQSFSVHSGIKQGCPLSPLLFIVVMDVLHHFLKKFSDVDVKLYCDDTAAGARDIAMQIKGIKEAFLLFESCTGLSLNLTKTVLLTTLAPSKRGHILRSLKANGWGGIRFEEQGIYLGIPFGIPNRETGINTAYNERVNRFTGRMVLYAKHRGTLSTAKRITLVNVFALPLLSYPFRFFLIPSNFGAAVQSDIDGLLNKNRSFKTMAYTATITDMGARGGTVLQDYWVQNLAALASRVTLAQLENHSIDTCIVKNVRGKRRVVKVLYTWSMRFTTNRAIHYKNRFHPYRFIIHPPGCIKSTWMYYTSR